jgi:hypothetical protein
LHILLKFLKSPQKSCGRTRSLLSKKGLPPETALDEEQLQGGEAAREVAGLIFSISGPTATMERIITAGDPPNNQPFDGF